MTKNQVQWKEYFHALYELLVFEVEDDTVNLILINAIIGCVSRLRTRTLRSPRAFAGTTTSSKNLQRFPTRRTSPRGTFGDSSRT